MGWTQTQEEDAAVQLRQLEHFYQAQESAPLKPLCLSNRSRRESNRNTEKESPIDNTAIR